MIGTHDFNIRIERMGMGDDQVFLVTGGERHIGAVATAYYMGKNVMTQYHIVPGHREGQLAAELAQLAAEQIGRTVTVLMGIHIEKASKADIEEVVRKVREMMREQLGLPVSDTSGVR